jgi:serine protease Do
VSAQLEASGHVTRGYVGVEAQQITGTTAKALHLSENAGALLAGVKSDSPASKAGLQPGDVIQSVDGKKVGNPRDLAVAVAAIRPGDEAKLQVLRDGQDKDFTVKVGQMPNDQTATNEVGTQGHHEEVGLALGPLSPEMRNQLDVPDGTSGAVVRQVRPGSPAELAGLQPGDVIVGVGTKTVSSPAQAVRAMRQALNGKDHALALRVIRNGEPVFVGVQLDQGNGEG